jgi:DNA-binding transcriptional MocR family regulator
VRRRAAAALGTLPETEAPPLSVAPPFAGLHERVSRVIDRGNAASDALNLGGASASATLYPAEPLQALAIRLLRRKPTLLTDAGPVGGSPEFRQTMARRALSYGVTVAPDDVMSTSGGVDAVNLALRAVAQPGDTIAIESPAFFGLIQMLESLGLRALEIPASPTTGLSIEALDVALTAYPDIRAVVVVPNLQNPLGSVMPDERKAALVALCSRHGVAVIEDEPYRELVEAPHAVKPVKAWDRDGTVIYCPSFNKVLAPGMRLGWISGPLARAREDAQVRAQPAQRGVAAGRRGRVRRLRRVRSPSAPVPRTASRAARRDDRCDRAAFSFRHENEPPAGRHASVDRAAGRRAFRSLVRRGAGPRDTDCAGFDLLEFRPLRRVHSACLHAGIRCGARRGDPNAWPIDTRCGGRCVSAGAGSARA